MTFWGGIPKVEDYITKLYLNYFRDAGIEPEHVIYVPEQDVATFMVAANMGGNIVPLSEKRADEHGKLPLYQARSAADV